MGAGRGGEGGSARESRMGGGRGLLLLVFLLA